MDFLIDRINADPYYFVRHHIDSYDSFVASAVPVIVSREVITIPKEKCTIVVEFHDDVEIEPPKITPNEARLNNYAYTSSLFANVTVTVHDKATGQTSHERHARVEIGALPVMVHSKLCRLRGMDRDMLYAMGECPYDAGGYFIVDGKEKVFVTQERNVTNRLFVEELKDKTHFSHVAFVRSTLDEETTLPKSLFLRVSTKRKDAIVVSVPRIGLADFPLFLLFRALGVESDADILDHVCGEDAQTRDFMRASVVDGNDLYTQEAAHAYLKAFVKYETVESLALVLLDDVLPNQGHSFASKARALGYMVRKLVRTRLRELQPTDRDSYLNKRLSVTGELLSNEFKVMFREFFNEAKSAIDNEYNVTHKNAYSFPFAVVDKINKSKIFQPSIVYEGLTKVLKGSSAVKDDLRAVQDLSRISYMSFLSHMRRVSAPLDASAKIVSPHLLSGSHWGCVCPSESPDGASIGLLKNLAVAVRITAGNRVKTGDLVSAIGREFGPDFVPLVRASVRSRATKVFVNDTWIGVLRAADALARIRAMRKSGEVHESVSISFDTVADEISLYADDGRCCRPLFVVDNVDDNKKNKRVVYLDIEECNTSALIAMTEKDVIPGRHTHVELHPATMFSVYTSTIPFANHNPAARNTFSGAQGKQAIGLYASSYNNRIDTAAYVLNAPQRPLVGTHLNAVLTHGKMHNGENVIVAIACYTGYNMEDSIILNKHSVERGMFNLTYYKNVFEREEDNEQSDENHVCTVISNPSVVSNTDGEFVLRKGASYAKLDADGLPRLNAYIDVGDAIVGMSLVETLGAEEETGLLTKFGQKKKTRIRDVSHLADQNYTGYVDRVYSMEDRAKVFCKARVRRFRIPELGDKFASRHGQKGVVGSLMPAEMMPFTSEGLVPDLIVNPHAFPSRMTVGQLLETIGAKFCATSGAAVETTAFEADEDRRFEAWGDELQRRGYDRHGNDVLYNGVTGEQLPTEIFIGPTYYYRLKHMVADKINHRSEGSVVSVTGQPTKGRSNGGGMRLGEMERDVLVAHGVLGFQHESFTARSDGHNPLIASRQATTLLAEDGTLTYVNEANGIVGTRDQAAGAKRITPVALPTAFKLLLQEIQALHVDVKLKSELFDVVKWRRRLSEKKI